MNENLAANGVRQRDVIYGRKYGAALTMDVFTPQDNRRGVAIIAVVSGGWYSSHENIQYVEPLLVSPLVERGYTVFAVVPSSQPKYTVPEIIEDVHRAVRFIRHHAERFFIDPKRIGICGGSAGGHLALMVGLTGGAGDAAADDLVERESSDVQAVAEFYAPTDFFNYGIPGMNAMGYGVLEHLRAPFDFQEFDPVSGRFSFLTDERKIAEIGRAISPINHVSTHAPPILAVHGDADLLVPLQQSQILVDKLRAAGVKTELVIKAGGEHGWDDMAKETALFADWFDTHL